MQSDPVLVATDFSDNARTAVRAAARLAKNWDAALTVMHCMEWAADLPSWHGSVSTETSAEYRQEALRKLEAEFDEAVPPPEQPTQTRFEVAIEFPEEGVTKLLENEEFGLAVIGATGLNRVANFFLGSVPEDIVRRSPSPVLVVPEDGKTDGYDQIVAPVDFTACSRQSLNRAVELAREEDAKLTVVHAVPVMADVQAVPSPGGAEPGVARAREQEREEQFDEFLEHTELEGIDWERRQKVGSPHDVVVETVEDVGGDLVVMGTHGRRGFERLFLGSTATKVLRRMPCSVMTVRAPEKSGEK